MKVALVTPGWPPAAFANGIASYVGNLHEGLSKLNVESRVLALAVGDDDIGSDIVDLTSIGRPASALEKVRGIYARYISRYGINTWTSEVQRQYARSVISGVEQLMPSFQPDVLEMDESFGAAGLVAGQLDIPVVVRLHGPYFINALAMGDAKDRAYYHRVREERKTILGATGITVPSLDLLERVRREYSTELPHAKVIANAAPTIPESGQWVQEGADQDLILFVGRFDRHKGGDIVLQAFAEIAAKRPSARLVFIGPDANYRTSDGQPLSLASFVEKHLPDESMRARFTHLGQLPASEIQPHRLKAAITVVASRYENFPMTVLEALAHGCPLIAPRAGGIPEIVDHKRNGLLFDPEDVNGLAEGIIRMIDHPKHAARMGRQGAEDIRNQFSELEIARKTKTYYESILERSVN